MGKTGRRGEERRGDWERGDEEMLGAAQVCGWFFLVGGKRVQAGSQKDEICFLRTACARRLHRAVSPRRPTMDAGEPPHRGGLQFRDGLQWTPGSRLTEVAYYSAV